MSATQSDQGLLKIAIPMAGGYFSEHFGAAKEFGMFVGDRTTGLSGRADLCVAPAHRPGSLPAWLAQQGVDAVVVSAIGERALILLADSGIETYLAADDLQPAALAAACLAGQLVRANQENSRCGGGHHHHDGHACHQ